jgi:hypothetical protein
MDDLVDVRLDDVEQAHCIISVGVVREDFGVEHASFLDLRLNVSMDVQIPSLEPNNLHACKKQAQ